ncbi:hypothetical protein J2W98_003673 [Paenibacillus peoriae]|uniref:Uncharacterized protein n=1 Tax=Paenibacillus peoriae TaxID=59893 RepID=A0ABU1QID3_9BACL|nr:hypothetical protein [Paenibacillus peoriae]MDR6779393.1 hypothetical protein [Paenibacillus peoriae]
MSQSKVKTIRPTVVHLDTEGYYRFVEYASSTEKTKSVGMDRMREMMQQHKSLKFNGSRVNK